MAERPLSPHTRALHLSVHLHELERMRTIGRFEGSLREKLEDLIDAVRQEIDELSIEARFVDGVAP
ncbi:MAG: hypothetical protein ACE147_00570 [Candidatus Methylomirabilales bacterium]